ncbi:MAG: type transport system ATP-binding protein, partial [Candidatus Binatota bacterium]|nr:type transport system ATP-binding protein [Candidatus Binatota bacterium]
MIDIEGLTKRYGTFTAVDDLTLRVERGEIFGFLGPNGAGKTTTIRMMMGLLLPTCGSIRLGGHDLATDGIEAKRISGFVPDRPFLYEKLTAHEILRFCADLYELEPAIAERQIADLLDLFDLASWSGELVESYSHGMKQRLAFCAALLHQPRILISDEPMVGMDPRGARMLRSLLRSLAERGVTIFLSTHSLEVAESLCDRIGILQRGRLIGVGTLEEL